MTEAAQAVVDYGFQFGLGAIGWAAEVHAGEPNYASLRVAEKLGFVQDGKIRAYFFNKGELYDGIFATLLPKNTLIPSA